MSRVISVAGILLLALAVVAVYLVRDRVLSADAPPARIAQLGERLAGLPLQLDDGRYDGERYEISPQVIEASGADAYVACAYRDEKGATYRVYIGGAIRNRESFHAPNYCMPAAGWEIVSQQSVPSPMGDTDARLRRLDLRKGDARMLVFYCFQCGRRQTDDDLVARWYRFLDFVSASFGLFDGDPIQPTMISTIYVPYGGSTEDADKRARRFMKAIRPALLSAVDPQEN
jgi:EpsI family protein